MSRIVEIQSGRMRPRHARFHRAFAELAAELGIETQLRNVSRARRLANVALSRWTGLRALDLNISDSVAVIHQMLNRGATPYIAEFDVPLGMHGYRIKAHQRAHDQAKSLMMRPTLRAVLVFSDWARGSFGLHFGPEVERKCVVSYPLAAARAYELPPDQRAIDFTFISTNFRIKCGLQVLRAFAHARQNVDANARLCMVTDLNAARATVGDLAAHDGVEWHEAKLSEEQIADVLARTRCLVHPSLSDSFGVVVLEALAAGCAVISTDIASFPEMVEDERNGLIFTPPTSSVVGKTFITEYGTVAYHEAYLNTLSLHEVEDALRLRMTRLLQTPSTMAAMMQASHDLFARRFSRDAWRRDMREILRESFPELFAAERETTASSEASA